MINNTSARSGRDLSDTTPLPGGGVQKTFATGYDAQGPRRCSTSPHLIQYDAKSQPTLINLFADRASSRPTSG